MDVHIIIYNAAGVGEMSGLTLHSLRTVMLNNVKCHIHHIIADSTQAEVVGPAVAMDMAATCHPAYHSLIQGHVTIL